MINKNKIKTNILQKRVSGRMVSSFLFLFTFLFSFSVYAEISSEEVKRREQAYEELAQKNKPKGMENKTRMNKKDFIKKKEGGFFTGLPLVNSDPNNGIGYGARVIYFQNGKITDEKFAYSPYKYRLFAQYFATTGGSTFHMIDFDAPYIFDSLFRLRTGLILDSKRAWRYFGSSAADTMGSLSVHNNGGPGAGTTMKGTLADFEETLKGSVNTPSNSRYFKYGYLKPTYTLSLEREIFGGMVRPLVGLQAERVILYKSGERYVSRSKETLLEYNCQQGKAKECVNAWNHLARFGIAFDTRDFEPNPKSGVFIDTMFELSNSAFFSVSNYNRYTVTFRGYYSPIPDLADIVLVGRAMYNYAWGEVPFYELNKFSQTAGKQDGLGGLRTMRGFAVNRFTGPIMTLFNFEARYTFAEMTIFGQHFSFMIVPFFDLGRTFDANADINLRGFRYTYGGGFRIPWNLATVIMIDFGISDEGTGLYINFDHTL